MKALNQRELEAVFAAIKKEPHDKNAFKSGAHKMSMGSGVRPEFAESYPRFPQLLGDFRAETTWSIAHVTRHQAACDAAWREYWRVMTSAPSP